MIAFVKGTVEHIEENAVIIDTGAFGTKVFMTPASLSSMKTGEEVKVYTYLRVAEDIFDLYGFLTREELDVFKMIISVNGAGPKAGLAVLSALSPAALSVAIVTDDYKSITRAQGVGPKLAQKIVLELKDKFKGREIKLDDTSGEIFSPVDTGNDAVEALVVLGYPRADALRAVSGVEKGLSTEDTIKAALIRLMR
ncbi:MAG: Holliday junction branch migration protein RuvA [Clostridia bacterium]|nr:Holliday junction branch migration protein RuvA [Clostridia bacterium]